MDIVIIEEYEGIPVGSVCTVIEKLGDMYTIHWGSMNGSYYIQVPVKCCKKYVEKPWLYDQETLKKMEGAFEEYDKSRF